MSAAGGGPRGDPGVVSRAGGGPPRDPEVLPLRIGLAGAGWVTEHHLDAYRRLEGRVRVVAVADPNLEAAARRAERYGIPAVFESVDQMLAAGGLDALDVATPRETHVPICMLAADAGLPILCQKPLAPTLPEARDLAAAVEGRVRLMVHENWRFRPHYRRIRRWIRDGRIGTVRTAFLRILTSGLLPDEDGALPALVRQPMMASLDRMLLMEVMIHHVDAIRFLVGPLDLRGSRLGKTSDAIRGEDRASLFLEGRDGSAVSLVGDFMAHGHPPEQRDHLEILGTRGAVTLEGDRLRLRGAESEEHQLDLAADYKASYTGAIRHFVDRVADGAPFETAPQDNLRTLEIVEAAYRGWEEDRAGGGRPGGTER